MQVFERQIIEIIVISSILTCLCDNYNKKKIFNVQMSALEYD